MSGASRYRARKAFWVANELERKPEFKIIYALTQPDADPNAVARKIVEYTRKEVDNSESTHVCDIAESIIEIARRTEDQSKLGNFVLALQQHWEEDDWKGLKWTFADELNQISKWLTSIANDGAGLLAEILLTKGEGGHSKKTRGEAKKDENLNTFVSKMTVRQAWDFASHGDSMLNHAFNLRMPEIPPGCAIHTLQLACTWYIYAAHIIWAKVQDPATKDGSKGEVWSLEMWNAWKEELLIAQANMGNYETRKMIQDAMVQLQQAEQRENQ